MAYSTLQTFSPDTCQMKELLKGICSSTGLSEVPLIFTYHYRNPFIYEPLIIVISHMIQQSLMSIHFKEILKTSLTSPLELVCVCVCVAGGGGGDVVVFLMGKFGLVLFKPHCH